MPLFNESLKVGNKKFDNAIIFVHGLNGSRDSWTGENSSFVSTLKKQSDVNANYQLFVFEYPSKILEVGFWKKIKAKLPFSGKKKDTFNVSIRAIAMELASDIRETLGDYKNIVIVAHSMGGLIVKRAIIDMQAVDLRKVKLVLSLSVPHHGASLAELGTKLLGKHIQLLDLKRFSDFTNELTYQFANLEDKPTVIYQSGHQDEIVNEGSAIPAGVTAAFRIDTNHNHYSVQDISDPASHTPYKRLLKELKALVTLGQQQSSSVKGNAPMEFDIPAGCSLKVIAELLTETASCTISFTGFTDAELAVGIRSQKVNAENTYKGLEALQHLTEEPSVRYKVNINGSHYELINHPN